MILFFLLCDYCVSLCLHKKGYIDVDNRFFRCNK